MSLPTKQEYRTSLLSDMIKNEKKLHHQFVKKRMGYRTERKPESNCKKARKLCSQERLSTLDDAAITENKENRENNNNSARESRRKKNTNRDVDALTVLHLRKRIAEYTTRIELLKRAITTATEINPGRPIDPESLKR